MRLKVKHYRSEVRPTLWFRPVDRKIEQKMSVAGMRMLKWIKRVTRV